jgi:Ca2+-binding RTX toxin-like protein
MRITGTDGADTLTSTNESDIIRGGSGEDLIIGNFGADELSGGADNDTFTFNGVMSSSPPPPGGKIDGGSGLDTIDLSAVSPTSVFGGADLTFTLSVGSQQFAVSGIERIVGGDAFGLNINLNGYGLDIEIVGGSAADTIIGGEGAESVLSGSGDDFIDTFGGADTVDAGDGNDVIKVSPGVDVLDGAAGDDVIIAGHTFSTFRPWAGTVISGGSGVDRFEFNTSGNTYVNLETGQANAYGFGGSSPFEMHGFENLWLNGFGGTWDIDGSEADNHIDLSEYARSYMNIYAEGRGGSDTLNGSNRDDALTGGDGDDWLAGHYGQDFLHGDWLPTDSGDDALYGGDGDDTLNGGAGNDLIEGGVGSDTASYSDAVEGVNVKLALKARDTGGAGVDKLVSIENLVGSTFNDELTGDARANRLDGGAGSDLLLGGDGADTLIGGVGSDRLKGGAGADTLNGGIGRDKLDGGTGGDTFQFTVITESTAGPKGRDEIIGFDGASGDRIDLSAIHSGDDDGAFNFVAAFSGVAGQLISVAQGSDSLVQADVTGDGRADFAILVVGVTVVEGDFVL